MRFFENKTIWILSPQEWGPIRISKHHYAMELAARGNRVFYVDPPLKALSRKIIITSIPEYRINHVRYRFYIPGKRFLPAIIKRLISQWQIMRLKNNIPYKPDIIWCFDFCTFHDLRPFGASFSILHIMDYEDHSGCDPSFSHADFIFTVTEGILDRLGSEKVQLIPHGLGRIFVESAKEKLATLTADHEASFNKTLKAGYIGSLFIKVLNRPVFKRLIPAFPDVQFDFIGPTSFNNVNIGGAVNNDTLEFIQFLEKQPNVRLLGTMSNAEITSIYHTYDVFLLFNIITNKNHVISNSHKILEYLSAGKVIFTDMRLDMNIEDLIYTSNEDIIEDFRDCISKLHFFNRTDIMKKRISHALENTYSKNIDKIEEIILHK